MMNDIHCTEHHHAAQDSFTLHSCLSQKSMLEPRIQHAMYNLNIITNFLHSIANKDSVLENSFQ